MRSSTGYLTTNIYKEVKLAKYHQSNLTVTSKHSNIKGCQRFFIGLNFFQYLQVSLAKYESPYRSARTTAWKRGPYSASLRHLDEDDPAHPPWYQMIKTHWKIICIRVLKRSLFRKILYRTTTQQSGYCTYPKLVNHIHAKCSAAVKSWFSENGLSLELAAENYYCLVESRTEKWKPGNKTRFSYDDSGK